MNSRNTELRRQIRELYQKRQQLADILDAHLAQHPGCPASVNLPLLPCSGPPTVAPQPSSTFLPSTGMSFAANEHLQLNDLTQWLV